ncbi:MAG: DUF2798 domain-containing protein [Rhizobacter sp.]|nr:DUF2798 domain-containing protein [Ferruginibacter sp.]
MAIAVCMGLCMGLVMSLVMTLANIGLVRGFFIKWMNAFAVGASIGIPLAMVVVPFVTKQLQKIAVD